MVKLALEKSGNILCYKIGVNFTKVILNWLSTNCHPRCHYPDLFMNMHLLDTSSGDES